MDFWTILIIFFSGVLAYALGIKLFGLWNKSLLYKLTFINCLAILRTCEGISKNVLKAAEVEDSKTIDIIFEHWQKMSLYSIKNIIPDVVWQDISVHDWEQAMKILTKLEKGVEDQNEV